MSTLGWLARQLHELADALVHRRPRSHTLGFLAGFRRDVAQAFERGADPVTGKAWAPLKYRKGQILVLSGQMRAAAQAAADAAKPEGTGVTIQLANPPYSVFQQFGTRLLPARRFFGASPRTLAEARRQYADDMVRLVVGGRVS